MRSCGCGCPQWPQFFRSHLSLVMYALPASSLGAGDGTTFAQMNRCNVGRLDCALPAPAAASPAPLVSKKWHAGRLYKIDHLFSFAYRMRHRLCHRGEDTAFTPTKRWHAGRLYKIDHLFSSTRRIVVATLPVPHVFIASVATTLPLPCVFHCLPLLKTVPLPFAFHCLRPLKTAPFPGGSLIRPSMSREAAPSNMDHHPN